MVIFGANYACGIVCVLPPLVEITTGFDVVSKTVFLYGADYIQMHGRVCACDAVLLSSSTIIDTPPTQSQSTKIRPFLVHLFPSLYTKSKSKLLAIPICHV